MRETLEDTICLSIGGRQITLADLAVYVDDIRETEEKLICEGKEIELQVTEQKMK